MKKLMVTLLTMLLVFTLTGCDMFGDGPNDDPNPNDNREKLSDCYGESDYVVIDGKCVVLGDLVSDNIQITSEETLVTYNNAVELMSNFVADLTGSTGLAVVPRDVYDQAVNMSNNSAAYMMQLADETDTTETENLIVKLTEEGFFEQVGFTDASGSEVQITSNPLALEVYGEYTVVIFEVINNYQNDNQDFMQKLWDSLYAGGIYLIHNESGKMFATKEVVMREETWTETQDHSRMVTLNVTLNEPVVELQKQEVLDENGNVVLDENGNVVYEDVAVPLLDKDGNPIVFTEGPIQYEEQNVPLVEYYKEFVVDDNGDPVLDENGEQVYNIIEEPVLDGDGNPIYETQMVPVVDENGDPVYQSNFDVELWIEDVREITHTNYYGEVTDNPLSQIAQRFLDKIAQEYYNWNYYRVNNYMISSYGFSASNEYIYYMQDKYDETTQETERFVMRISFDDLTNELILEEYLNATKARFDECEIILDPNTNNIICDPWEQDNIKMYSETYGLQTIEDSDNLQPVTFPNGELYFYSNYEQYVEDLGYYTASLYTFNEDGTLQQHFIELGEKPELCYQDCYNSISANMMSSTGELYQENQWVDLQISSGGHLIEEADLTITSIGEFDSSRPECTDSNGCWVNIRYELEDTNGDLVTSFEKGEMVFPGDPALPYVIRYSIDNASYEYQRQWTNDDQLCENTELGCSSSASLIDYSVRTDGLWLNTNILYEYGDTLIQQIKLNETNNAVYEYTKDVSGLVCEYATCEEYVPIRIYDQDGELLSEYHNNVSISQDEIIPLYIELYITENTIYEVEEGVCTTSTGCWRYYSDGDLYFYINYAQGDTMYASLDFAETDRVDVTEETLTSAVCTNQNGCGQDNVIYSIFDDTGTLLYEFSGYVWYQYGERVPYSVSATLSDVEITYKKQSSEQTKLCEETTCNEYVDYFLGTDAWDWDNHLGGTYMTFNQGDPIIGQVMLNDPTPTSTTDQLLCTNTEGCTLYTNNYTVLDADGNSYDITNEDWWKSWMPVSFAFGDPIPVTDDFEVSFLISNMVYRTHRMSTYDFIYNLHNVQVLDENLFLIEGNNWDNTSENIILTFNEATGRYSAKYTNIGEMTEITAFENGYIAINEDETAILNFVFNELNSTDDYYYFDVVNLTEGLQINGVNDLIIDYDGSIYFKGVDNFIQDITGTILQDGTVTIDTEYTEREIIRVRPIN